MQEFVTLENRKELNKRKATFVDRFKKYANQEDAIQEQKIVEQIKNARLAREEALVSGGAVLPLDVMKDGSVNDNREAEIDSLVREYNNNPDNTKKLKTSEEIENDALSLLRPDSNVDFSGDGIKNALAYASVLVYKHPVEILASAVGLSVLPSVIAAFGVGAGLAGLASEVAVVGAIEANKVLNKKSTADILSEKGKQETGLEDVNVAKEIAINTFITITLGKIVSVLGGVAKNVGKKVFPFVSRTAKQTEPIISKVTAESTAEALGPKSIDTALRNLAEEGTAEETAVFVDAIKQARPSSVIPIEQRAQVEKDLLDYFDAMVSGDANKISEVLGKESMPIVSKEANDLAMEAISQQAGIELSEDMIPEVVDLYNSTREEFSDILKKRISENLSEAPKDKDFLANKASEYFKERFPTAYSNNNNNLKMFDELKDSMTNLANNGVELKLGGFKLEDFRVLHKPSQKTVALEFNKALRKVELTEMLVSGLEKRKNVSVNAVVASVGNYLELVENEATSTIFPEFEKLADSISLATRGQSSKLDVAEFYDVVMGKSSSSRMLGIKNAWQESLNNIQRYAVESGLDFTGDTPYFPNRWNPAKIVSKKKDEFIADMLASVDAEAMKKLTSNEVNEEFFSKMYDGLINNDSVKKGRSIVMKDGEAWKFAHEKYGKISTVDEVIATTHISAKNQIASSLRDTNNSAYIREQLNTIKNIAIKKNSSEKFITELNKKTKALEKIIGNELGDPMEQLNPILRTAVSGLMTAKTAMAPLTAYVSDRLGTMPNAFNGIGVKDYYQKSLFGALSSASKKELRDIFNISVNFNRKVRMMAEDALRFSSVRNTLAKTGGNIYMAPSKTLGWVAESNEIFSNYMFGTNVARKFHLPFDKLNKKTREFLSTSGFEPHHWDILRGIKPQYLGDSPIISSNILNKYLEEGVFSKAEITLIKDVRNKLAYAETSFSLLATPRSTEIGKSAVFRTDTAFGQIQTALTLPFMNITHSMSVYAFREAMERFGDVFVGPRLVFAALVGATASYSIRGNKIDPKDPAFYYRIATQSGMFGVSELLLSEVFGVGYLSDVGTLSQGVKDIAKGKIFKGGRTIVNKFNPYANLTLLGTLATSYTTDLLFRMMDPAGATVYDKELRKKLYKGQISSLAYEARKPKLR